MSATLRTSDEKVGGFVVGAPAPLMRLEGAALLVGSLLAYATTDRPWWLVPLALLLPDLSIVGYLAGPKVGARTYNLAHTTPLPGLLIGFGWWQDSHLAVALGLIWLVHIALHRMLGPGLKYDDDFRHTHVGGSG